MFRLQRHLVIFAGLLVVIGCLAVSSGATTTPTCSGGTQLLPGANLSAAVNSAPAGTTFCLAPGPYPTAKSVLMKSYDRLIGPGAVIDFTGAALDGSGNSWFGIYGYGGTTGQHNVTIDGITVEHCSKLPLSGQNCSGLKEGDNWTVRNVILHDNDIGLQGGCDTCTIIHNAVYGVTSPFSVTNSEIAYNGGTKDSGGSTGGSKAVQNAHASWVNDYVHDNLGPGIWCDGCWRGSTFSVSNSRIVHNKGAGVDFEITWGGSVTNTYFAGNAYDQVGKSCFWGAQLLVQNSPGVTVTGNTFNSSGGENALCTVNTVRSVGLPTYPETVTPFVATGNTFILHGAALTGNAGNRNGTSTFQSSDPSAANYYLFDRNIYEVDSLSAAHWSSWVTSPMTWAAWRNLGQDAVNTLVVR
jgi:hypothetical protein